MSTWIPESSLQSFKSLQRKHSASNPPDKHISGDDYANAQKVWETFECPDLGHYHDLYLRTDVFLLADVFDTFWKTYMQKYDLDPTH